MCRFAVHTCVHFGDVAERSCGISPEILAPYMILSHTPNRNTGVQECNKKISPSLLTNRLDPKRVAMNLKEHSTKMCVSGILSAFSRYAASSARLVGSWTLCSCNTTISTFPIVWSAKLHLNGNGYGPWFQGVCRSLETKSTRGLSPSSSRVTPICTCRSTLLLSHHFDASQPQIISCASVSRRTFSLTPWRCKLKASRVRYYGSKGFDTILQLAIFEAFNKFTLPSWDFPVYVWICT